MMANTERPNLIFVFADQLRYQSCGFAGDTKARTPYIDQFATQSVDFCNAVSGYPVCGPYRASLLTGKYPSSTGMVINELRSMPDPDAWGHVLTSSGYQTGYVGKWHLYANSTKHTVERQFIPPGPYRLGFDGYWAGYNFNHNYFKGVYYEDMAEPHFVDGYEPELQTELAIDFLKHTNRKQPFALFLSYGIPHDPWVPENCPAEYIRMFEGEDFDDPPNYRDGSAEYWNPSLDAAWWQEEWKPNRKKYRKIYYAMTTSLDHYFGQLMQAVDELGFRENTLVVFTSDHGEMFGAQGRLAKKIFYEEAVRVPFLVRWPQQIPAGSVCDACLDTPDIMPTLLDLMGLPIPDSVEGMSLKKRALGQPGPEPDAAFMQGMGHTFLWLDGDEWRAVRDKQFTYARMHNDGSEYLFDHQADPYQMNNLVLHPNYREHLEKYREMLERRMNALNDSFESCTWYRDHWVEDRIILRSATRSRDGQN